jgi:YebC/PmpR family DNA-binding regulatory protein
MPTDNIDRAIKKGAGELEGSVFHEIMYEGYAGGVAFIVMVLTDNKNRSAAEIRHIFTKHNSDFAGQGSVLRGFTRKGQIFVDASVVDEDKLMALVLEAGAEDMQNNDGQYEILTDPSSFADVMQAMEKAGIATQGGEVAMVPLTYVPITNKAVVQSVQRFVADLEDHDDVQNVYTNMDVDEATMKEIQG